MTPGRDDLWTRFLDGEALSPGEEAELLRALDADPSLRRELLDDEDLHRALSAFERANRDGESFARSLKRRISMEGDGSDFVQKVARRIGTRRRLGAPRPGGAWKLGFAAAALILAAVALTMPRPPAPPPRVAVQETPPPPSVDPAAKERERLARDLVQAEREKQRIAEEAGRAQDAQKQAELKAREAELEAVARRYREELQRAREPKPEPATPPVAPPRELPPTRAVVARLEGAGRDLQEGDGVRGPSVVAFPDGTRLEVGADAELRDLRAAGGKRLRVEKGTVVAHVQKQPAGQAMEFETAHGRVRVLGTVLRIAVRPDSTRVDVREGRVQVGDLSGKSVEVPAGQYAMIAPGKAPVVKAIPKILLEEDFEDPKAVAARWILLPGGFPVATAGGLEVDLSPRPNDPYPGDWHASGGLLGRTALRVPFRVSVDVEMSHRHSHVVAAMHFLPRLDPAGSPDEPLWICFKRGEYEFITGTNEVATPQVKAAGPWPRKERWTAEFDKEELRLFVDDREVLRAPQVPRQPAYYLRLDANAQLDAPSGAKVRFDNLRVEELR